MLTRLHWGFPSRFWNILFDFGFPGKRVGPLSHCLGAQPSLPRSSSVDACVWLLVPKRIWCIGTVHAFLQRVTRPVSPTLAPSQRPAVLTVAGSAACKVQPS